MNWRGETFYSRNTVEQIPWATRTLRCATTRPSPAASGRSWSTTAWASLTGAVGADKKVTVIDRDINNKFVLVTID